MYRIKIKYEDESKTLFKSQTLEGVITNAINSKSFRIQDIHSLSLEKEQAGEWKGVEPRSGVKIFSPAREDPLKG